MNSYFSRFISLNRYFILFEKIMVAVILFSMILLSFGQVVARNIFSTGFIWIDQVLRLEVLWVTFIGAALATEYNQHIKIDFLSSMINSERSKRIIGTGAYLFTFLICSLLFLIALHYIHVVSSDSTSTVIHGIPDWSFRCIIPYCFFMVSVRSVINIMKMYYGKDVHNG